MSDVCAYVCVCVCWRGVCCFALCVRVCWRGVCCVVCGWFCVRGVCSLQGWCVVLMCLLCVLCVCVSFSRQNLLHAVSELQRALLGSGALPCLFVGAILISFQYDLVNRFQIIMGRIYPVIESPNEANNLLGKRTHAGVSVNVFDCVGVLCG